MKLEQPYGDHDRRPQPDPRARTKELPGGRLWLLMGTCADVVVYVTATRPAGNRHPEERARRYLIDSDSFRTAARAAAEQGLDVVGFYHSHPDHPARPSPTDLAEATFPGYVYVIVSVQSGEPTDLTVWTLADDRSQFNEERIVQIESSTVP